MSALEAELLDKLLKLDAAARHRVIDAAMAFEASTGTFTSWDAWLKAADELTLALSQKYAGRAKIDVSQLLREVREEES